MRPDFSAKSKAILARRAAFKCSNPDCRVSTVGPNSEEDKAALIGEAAHIFGARPGAKRYRSSMTDAARAEITNAIWLCRNCHKLIDTDEQRYTSDILFAWREQHEEYTQSELGNSTDRIQLEEQNTKLSLFENYPPIIRRIAIDKAPGWEWRLTAEIMRYLNRPYFRKLEDLRDGLYVKPRRYLDDEHVVKWTRMRLNEASNLFDPMTSLLDRLNQSWGSPGEQGNIEEIHHVVCLIRDHLQQIVFYEEQISFVGVSEKYDRLIDLLKDIVGSQAVKLAEIPDTLDEFVSMLDTDHDGTIENPRIMKKTISFDLPKDWSKQMNRELKRAESSGSLSGGLLSGCLILFVIFFVIYLLVLAN